MGEGDFTAPTAEDKTAVTALNKAGASSTIKKQNYLLPSGYRSSCSQRQSATESAPVARLELIPQIHHLNLGEW
jgi:hypothetical protein